MTLFCKKWFNSIRNDIFNEKLNNVIDKIIVKQFNNFNNLFITLISSKGVLILQKYF